MATVRTEDRGHVRTIIMDRPDALNAFNTDLMHELCEAFLAAATDNQVRVVVLTGAGRAFSAGADLKSMGSPPKPGQKDFSQMLDAIIDCPKPFIVAANGLGVGIGLTICGLADLTLMARSAKFRTPFSALGLTAEAASTYTFPMLLGHQQASWVLLSGDWISADTCKEIGLAIDVVEDDALMDEVARRADMLATLPPTSLAKTKALMKAPHREAIRQAVLAENAGLAELSGSPANREAIKAFMEKREPDFSGL